MRVFISCVSAEFGSVRDQLSRGLSTPHDEVKVQRDFTVGGGPLLEKLDRYLRHCDRLRERDGPGDLDRAAASWREGLNLARHLAERDPDSAEAARDLWWSYQRTAQIAEQRGEPDAADWWQRALDGMLAMQRAGTLAERDRWFIDDARDALTRLGKPGGRNG
jgi:hypothetical protein